MKYMYQLQLLCINKEVMEEWAMENDPQDAGTCCTSLAAAQNAMEKNTATSVNYQGLIPSAQLAYDAFQ